jgi:CRISPR-associated protein Cas2
MLRLGYGGDEMYLVLVYDINLDQKGQKILRNVFKICKKYLIHIQNSVFEGEMSESQFMEMKIALRGLLREGQDSCMVFKSRNNKWLEKEFLVKEADNTSAFL